MSSTDGMTINERRKYLSRMQERYSQSDRAARSQLLDEMEAVTELHRKSLVRLMNSNLDRHARQRQRGRSYGPEFDDALRIMAEALDHICAERMMPFLPWLAKHLAMHGELVASPDLLNQLQRVSVSTVARRLERIRQDQRRLPRRKPRPTNNVTRDVPMRRIPWDEREPGHFETDLVHHCGASASGEYMHTIQMVDVATGWSERRAVLGRSYLVMSDAFRCISRRLPFPILEIHPDNGSEFFNHHMARFWGLIVQPFRLSRCRPYQRNDNRFVEQKNDTLVRAYLGHKRLDTVEQTLATNRLYDKMWLYHNFFQPVMRLADKELVSDGSQLIRIKRRHDRAQPPFDRLCQTTAITLQHRACLEDLRDRTNPLQLHQEIYDLLEVIFSMSCATPGVAENVHRTLSAPSSRRQQESGLVMFSFNRTLIAEEKPAY